MLLSNEDEARFEAEADSKSIDKEDEDEDGINITIDNNTDNNTDNNETELEQVESAKKTRILIFDSLGLTSRGKGLTVINRLKSYLQLEAKDKLNRLTSKSNCSGHIVKVPQQENYTDCGCFLVQFVEEFFKCDPFVVLEKMIKHSFDMNKWFEPVIAQGRRELMKNRMEQLAHDYAEREKFLNVNDAKTSKGNDEEDRSSDIEEIIM